MNEEQKKKQEYLLREGSVKLSLFQLGIPSIVAMLVNAFYIFVDTYFIGMLDNTAAMSAVSLAMPLSIIMGSFGAMIAVGGSAYVSRNLGAKNNEIANQSATLSFVLSIILSIVLTIACLLFLTQILQMLGASNEVLPYAKSYTRIFVLGSVFLILNSVLSSMVRSEGAAKFSMYALLIGAILNIILCPIFIFTLNMGISGAAVATVLSQIVTTLYLVNFYIRKKGIVVISANYIKMPIKRMKEITWEIMKIGFPIFLLQILFSLSGSILNNMAAAYGDATLAAIGISGRIYQIPLFIFMGFIQGFQPFAAYNYGAKRIDRIRESLKFTTFLFVGFAIVTSVSLHFFADSLVAMFTNDPVVINIAVNYLTASLYTMPFVGVVLVYSVLFQSLGKAKYATFLSISRQGLIFIPIVSFLPYLYVTLGNKLAFTYNALPFEMEAGLYGLVYAQPVSDMFSFLLTLVLAKSIHKHLREEERRFTQQDVGA